MEQTAAVPSLPDDVVIKTREKYIEAFHRLTGRELNDEATKNALEQP
jgi:hypothetical protein